MNEPGFPRPRDDDHEDVHWALTTAQSLQSQGEYNEALRWVRKAVAAAVACDLDARAIELGRLAAELEESLGAATTKRGRKGASATVPGGTPPTVLDAPLDDDATSIDDAPSQLDPRSTLPIEAIVESEPTLVPFTKISAGASSAPTARRPPRLKDEPAKGAALATNKTVSMEDLEDVVAPEPPKNANRDTFTMPAFTLDALHAEAEAKAVERKGASSVTTMTHGSFAATDEASQASEGKHWRVALLASPDGETRVMVLNRGDVPPEGSGVATLVAATADDAEAIAALLGQKPR